jgi:hypothetical protein
MAVLPARTYLRSIGLRGRRSVLGLSSAVFLTSQARDGAHGKFVSDAAPDRLMSMQQRSVMPGPLQKAGPPTHINQEFIMKTKQLLNVAVVALVLSPLSAFAFNGGGGGGGGGDEGSRQWLNSLKSTRTVQEVRAEARLARNYGERHPVEVELAPESTRSRAEVRADLAMYGVPMIGA